MQTPALRYLYLKFFILVFMPCTLLSVPLNIPGFAIAAGYTLPPVVLDSRERYQVGSHLEILEDKKKELTIAEISSPEFKDSFRAVRHSVPNLGITRSAIWARFRVKNSDEKIRHMLLSYDYPLTDSVSLFIPKSEGGFTRIDAGHSVPDSVAAIPHRYYVFPLRIPAQTEITCFMRVESGANMVLPATLWTPEALDRQDHSDQMIFGIFFGVIFAFIVYFAAVSIKLRNPASMWFTFYITFLGLLMASYQGYLQEQLGHGNYQWNSIILISVIGLLYFTGAKFLRTFLNVHTYSRWIDITLAVLQWMGLLFIPMNMFPNPFTPLLGLILAGAGPVFSTTVSIVFWIRGVPNAKYFATGWFVGHLTSELDLLRVFGLIPWIPIMAYLLPAALFSSIIFFSMAVVEQSREYRYFANRDGLTGLSNRRYFDEMMDMEWNRSLRNSRPISVIMLDVDCFKAYNDTYGHKAGDECLIAIADVLKKTVRRAGDIPARYGGEEFVAVLCETNAKDASVLAERIRVSVEDLAMPHSSSDVSGYVTVSLGVSSAIPGRNLKQSDLIKQADDALYKAKTGGRNRVVLC